MGLSKIIAINNRESNSFIQFLRTKPYIYIYINIDVISTKDIKALGWELQEPSAGTAHTPGRTCW